MTESAPSPAADPDRIRIEMEKAASLVGTARRLLATGTTVDLSALEGRVRQICDGIAGLGRESGREFRPGIEALIVDLDRLAEALDANGQAGAPRL